MMYKIALYIYKLAFVLVLSRLPLSVRRRVILFLNRVRSKLFPKFHSSQVNINEPISLDYSWKPNFPGWLYNEMVDLSKLEAALNPSQGKIEKFEYFTVAVQPSVGEAYQNVLSGIPGTEYDCILIAPWIKMGGADLAILHHLSYLSRSNRKTLLILTEPEESTWLDRVPRDVDVLEFRTLCDEHTKEDQQLLLERLLIQFAPKDIHIINSRTAWACLQRSGAAISSLSDVYVSLYCDDVDENGCPVGYAREFLLSTYGYIKKIITDNSVYVEVLQDVFGLSHEKFAVVRLPTDEKLLTIDIESRSGPQRVLWCGRFDAQKRPELLMEISQLMPSVEFHVYGQVITGDHSVLKAMNARDNIKLHSAYDKFIDVASKYRVMLNTSAWDGLPNILVEAAASGLTIVTSNVGGISDLVDSESGYVIDRHSDPSKYIESIRECLSDPEAACRKSQNARQRILAYHTRDAFDREMNALFGVSEAGRMKEFNWAV